MPLTTYVKDPHSYAQPSEAVITHLELDLKVSFETRKMEGKATWDCVYADTAKYIYFDTHFINIKGVKDGNGNTLAYEWLPNDEFLGRALKIEVPSHPAKIEIDYSTTDSSLALQWLSPEQTAGKKTPFLYTQSQAILCRSWIPSQDSPGIRFTYNARVEVPKGYLALMSAKNPVEKNETGIYTFEQPYPVPAYLMALSVGDIEFKPTGKRTGVYAEPVTLEKAAWEFAETEKMIVAAEALYGPYAWDRYDILVLPPSFPFGGMENPMLTFATPTVIAGDRSLTALVAHELAHSWSGNLVTNATWNDFWLNEGFTVYFERRIMESIEDASYTDMLACLGYGDLELTMGDFYAASDSADTQLKLKLDGRDPDNGMSDVAYEKGYMLLLLMEKTVGREKWDAFLKKYFAEFKFKTLTTEKFIDYVYANLFTKGSKEDQTIRMQDWIYKPGLPEGFQKPASKRFEKVEEQANAFLQGKIPAAKIDTSHWTSHEYQCFLRTVKKEISFSQMKDLDVVFHFTHSGNSEILALWVESAIIHEYKDAYPALKNFLNSVGRRKFLMPLYKAMMANPATVDMAKEIYATARKNYHSVSVGTIDEIVK